MKIAIGSDHRCFLKKQELIESLNYIDAKYKIINIDKNYLGKPLSKDYDYPDYAHEVSRMVSSGEADKGVLICGTGIGMCMAANKIKGARAALVHNTVEAIMSKKHNDSNILCFGEHIKNICDIVIQWAETSASEEDRHVRRVCKIEPTLEKGLWI